MLSDRPLSLALRSAFVAGAASVLVAGSGADVAPPHIPLCTGMTLITAINDATGDYESIKTIESADDTLVRIKYTAQKMDYGDIFATDPPKLRRFESKRVVRRADMRTARAYLQEFTPVIPEAVPGMTALGTSTLVLNELKTKREAEFGISHWAFVVPPTLDPNDSQGIYHKQMSTTSKVVDRVTIPVLVNGVAAELPAIHTRGNFYGYISELWFLDQPDNPLTLRFRIGIGEFAPLSPADRQRCAADAKSLGYPPEGCLHPDGADKSTLDLVKINFRCGERALPDAAGAGSGAPAAGSGAGATIKPGAGATPGAGAARGAVAAPASQPAGTGAAPPLDAAKLEQALLKDGRVEIPDIFFAFNSDEIREESAVRLRDIAQVVKAHPEWKLKVEGHTDSLAADDYNLKLSQRRAAAVKNALVTQYGLDGTRLATEGFGETRPRASNDSLAGRARNRRVELVREIVR